MTNFTIRPDFKQGISKETKDEMNERDKTRESMAKLTILCYDQLHTSLQSNGMAAIPKN